MNAGGDDTPFQRARGARERRFFVASVPALPGCHTQAHSLDQLMARIQPASLTSWVFNGWLLRREPLSSGHGQTAAGGAGWSLKNRATPSMPTKGLQPSYVVQQIVEQRHGDRRPGWA